MDSLEPQQYTDQRNGAILGIPGALFECRFASVLAVIYNEKAEENGIEFGQFDQDTYSDALTKALTQFAYENMTQFGRLLDMKHDLQNLSEEESLSEQQLALIYLKDIATVRGLDEADESIVEEVLSAVPS